MAASSSPSRDALTPSEAEAIIRRRIDADIDQRADAFVLHPDYEVGRLAHRALISFSSGSANRSQMRKLERVALTASAYTDIINYVKSQSGRSTRTGDEWRVGNFGMQLHDQLKSICQEAEGRASNLVDDVERRLLDCFTKEGERKKDAQKRLQTWAQHEMRLAYVQRYVRHLVAEYMYQLGDALASTARS